MTTIHATRPPIVTPGSPNARRSDPDTSHEAADGNDIHGARAEVMFYLGLEPLADHELVAMFEADANLVGAKTYTPQRLRTARAELVEMGLVEATGIYRLTATKGKANVWQLKGAS